MPFTPAAQKLVNCEYVIVHMSDPMRITPDSQTVLDQFVNNMSQMIRWVNVASPYCLPINL